MGIPLLAGRDFDTHDTTSSPRVAIVNQTFIHKLGFSANSIGQQFRREATPSLPEMVFQIVGIVKDTKYHNLREEFPPIVYVPTTQDTEPDPFARIVIRSDTTLASTTSGIRNAVNEVNPKIGLTFREFGDTVRAGLVRERLMASLSGFFGVLAALICSVGLYGVMSYLVARRTNEIGIRIALGADRRRIVGLILRQATTLLVPGLVIGTLFAFGLTESARSLLFGLQPHDLGIVADAAVLLASVTLIASYLPARRASRTEPMAALREE
jgi:ABC-type antimicrobial peptide transport system permease subunit